MRVRRHDVPAGDVADAPAAEDLVLDRHERAALEPRLVDAPGDVHEIEVRRLDRLREAVHHVARAQQRHVEGLAVVGDDHRRLGDALGEQIEDRGLFAEAPQERLLEDEEVGLGIEARRDRAGTAPSPSRPRARWSRCRGRARAADHTRRAPDRGPGARASPDRRGWRRGAGRARRERRGTIERGGGRAAPPACAARRTAARRAWDRRGAEPGRRARRCARCDRGARRARAAPERGAPPQQARASRAQRARAQERRPARRRRATTAGERAS